MRETSIRRLFYAVLAHAADSWRLPQGVMLALWSLPVLVVMGGVVAALLGVDAYKWYIGEDGFAETAQVIFYGVAAVFSYLVVRRLRAAGTKRMFLLYSVVVFALVCMVGEELSWGQRIFDWETSDFMKSINKQEETTFHNIRGVHLVFKALQLCLGAYGTILPILLVRVDYLRRNEFYSFVIPHYALVPFFVPLFVWRIFRTALDAPPGFQFVVSEFNEVMELVLAIGVALFMMYQWRRLRDPEPESVNNAGAG